jgi:hypothetical protein
MLEMLLLLAVPSFQQPIGNGFDLLNSRLITEIVKGREANHAGKQNACGSVGLGDRPLPILHLLVNGSGWMFSERFSSSCRQFISLLMRRED